MLIQMGRTFESVENAEEWGTISIFRAFSAAENMLQKLALGVGVSFPIVKQVGLQIFFICKN